MFAYELAEGTVGELEAFADEFERLVKTPEQVKLAVSFKDFVAEMDPKVLYRGYLQSVLDRMPEASENCDKNLDLER